MLANSRNINVINLVRSESSVRGLEAAGAKHVLSSSDPEWAQKVTQITAGAPVVRAVDSISGKAANELMNVLAGGGELISFGNLSGEPLIIDTANVVFKQTTIKGFWGSKRSASTSPGDMKRMVGDLLRLAGSGALPLRVEDVFDLSQASEAAAAAEKPSKGGKTVLRAS
jgi:NADPH:quinone reductase-like Zn-dependent oxidoreductase